MTIKIAGIFFILTLAFAAAVFSFEKFFDESDEEIAEPLQDTVKIGEFTLKVDVADTAPERSQGLSGREQIGEDEGMLFMFDIPRRYSFWMRDMRFPIDIVWIGEDLTIVDITENLRPESYPAHYQPREPAQYVLEVNSGWARKHNIQIGQKAAFNIGSQKLVQVQIHSIHLCL